MSIELKGRQRLSISEESLNSILEIARECGWEAEYKRASAEETGLGYPIDDIVEGSARALAKVLYHVIHEIESDCLSDALFKLVQTAGVRKMRAVADLAYVGTFYID
jgi:hypothetical protein